MMDGLGCPDESLDIACAEGSLHAISSNDFWRVVENDGALIIVLDYCADYGPDVSVAFIEEGFCEEGERGGDIPEMDDFDFVSFDEICEVLEEVAHLSPPLEPTAAAELHVEIFGLAGHRVDSFVGLFGANKVGDSSDEFFGGRVVGMESQMHPVGLQVGHHLSQEVVHVVPQLVLGVDSSELQGESLQKVSVAGSPLGPPSDQVRVGRAHSTRLPCENSHEYPTLLQNHYEVFELGYHLLPSLQVQNYLFAFPHSTHPHVPQCKTMLFELPSQTT